MEIKNPRNYRIKGEERIGNFVDKEAHLLGFSRQNVIGNLVKSDWF